MEIENIINTSIENFKQKVAELLKKVEKGLDVLQLEQDLEQCSKELTAPIMAGTINKILENKGLLLVLVSLANALNLQYQGYRWVKVRLVTGISVRVYSPYFSPKIRTRYKRKKKRKKRAKKNKDAHLGLSYLGFVDKNSGNLVEKVVNMSSMASFELTVNLLKVDLINLNKKTVRKICEDIGDISLAARGTINIAEADTKIVSKLSEQVRKKIKVADAADLSKTKEPPIYRLVIGIDGGRLRIRTKKRGRKRAGQKQQGYHTHWKEPKLFCLYMVDKEGNKVKDFLPIYEGTMEKNKGIFDILSLYLGNLPVQQFGGITFCGDGAKWIWNGVRELLEQLQATASISLPAIHQVIDYTHAKQALKEIWDRLPKKYSKAKKQRLWAKWKALLWQGNIDALKTEIKIHLTARQRKAGLKKWQDYFKANQERMQFQSFEANNLPTGSGCIESTIRRVLNLRLKSAGSFWDKQMAERMIFLRAQVLTGRMSIIIKNLRNRLFYNIAEHNSTLSIQFNACDQKKSLAMAG